MTDAAPSPDLSSVAVECDLDERPDMVWRALTTPEIVAEWLGPNTLSRDGDPSFEVRLAPEEGGTVACTILEAIPPERLSYTWRIGDPQEPGTIDSVVTFTLTPNRSGGTHLRIVHHGLERAARQPPMLMLAAGRSLRGLGPHARPSARVRRGAARAAPLRRLPLIGLRRAA
ncbi:MAG TPA: SRPBCC domain-containing protein [Microvirga sp.]|jgi:uncharacterized protein YndB with AHSA1/START domain|nr:SRPBCC domain-containing protein [Microvirga sp.]